jgi:hypothetical protein
MVMKKKKTSVKFNGEKVTKPPKYQNLKASVDEENKDPFTHVEEIRPAETRSECIRLP